MAKKRKKSSSTDGGSIAGLVKAAEDLNEVLGLDPVIDTELAEEELIAEIKTNAEEVATKDKLTSGTWDVLEQLEVGPGRPTEKKGKSRRAAQPASKPEKFKATKATPAPKKKEPSPYGTGVSVMCKNPDITRAKYSSTMTKKGFDPTASAVGTAYSAVRSVVAKLREAGNMK